MAADLQAMRTKVRRLTRSLSTAQLSDEQIDDYINTFVLYDLPEHLRLFSLHTTLSWFCEPFIDVYLTDSSVDPNSALFNFKNLYITTNPPIYIAGYLSGYYQSREQFFGIYPQTNSIASINTNGDGATTNFTGTLANIPILRNNVLFDSIDATNNGLEIHDNGLGGLTGDGFGTIDYITGEFDITFNVAPAAAAVINSQTIPYVPAQPQSLLYYDNKFTLRPVPDQPYRIQMEVYKRPTQLIESTQVPELDQWWQFISYGASRKVFQDRMDMESLQMIEPEYKQQELLVLRRTIVQQTNQRTPTIYTENVAGGYGSGWYYGGGQF